MIQAQLDAGQSAETTAGESSDAHLWGLSDWPPPLDHCFLADIKRNSHLLL